MNPTWLFVAAVYAIAAALARRLLPPRVALLFYVLVLGFLFEPLTGRAVNVHADVLKTIPPWVFVTGDHHVANGRMNDVPLQEVPWAHVVRESWRSLRAPLWNATTACGAPLLGNAQSAGLSPLRLIALPLSLGHAMTAEAAMKLLIALTFMFLYCRRRWSEGASVIAAISFAFSGFFFVWLHFPIATAGVFLPGVLYFIDLLVEDATYARLAGAAVLWAAILYSGHPETAAHMFLVALLYTLWLRPRWKTLVTLGGAMVIAALLATPFLATFSEAMTKSRRYRNLQIEPFSATEMPFSNWQSAVVILQPLFYGPYDQPWGPSELDALTAFAGVLGVAAWVAVAWWVVATRAWRSREAFFALLALLMLGVVFDWPGFADAMHFILPLGAHARLRLVLVCAFAIQIAAAIDLAPGRPLLIGLGVAAAALIAIFAGIDFPALVRDRRPAALLAAVPSFGVLIVCAAMLFSRTKFALGALIFAVVAEMWIPGRAFNPATTDALMYPRTPLIDKLRSLDGGRVAGYGAMLFPNTPALYGFEDIRVHDPMANNRYVEFLAATSTYDPRPYFGMWFDTNTHVLDFLNVRYLVTDPNVPVADRTRWRQIYDGPDGWIFENRTVLPRFFAARNVVLEFNDEAFARRLRDMDDKWSHTVLLEELKLENRRMHDDFFSPRPADAPEARVEIVGSAATEYRIRTTAPRYTLVASSIPWWPGWKVERNGRRIEPVRVNGAFLGFAVPEGVCDVRVWYAPATFRWGALVAAATALALVANGIYGSAARGRAYPPASTAA